MRAHTKILAVIERTLSPAQRGQLVCFARTRRAQSSGYWRGGGLHTVNSARRQKFGGPGRFQLLRAVETEPTRERRVHDFKVKPVPVWRPSNPRIFRYGDSNGGR